MQHQTPQVDRVVLIRDKDSALADRIAADLQAKGLSVVQRESREPPDSEQAAIFLVESPAAIDWSAPLLEGYPPTLVLASTDDIVAALLPLLGSGHDVGSTSDSTDVVVWRLARLAQGSRRLTELDPLTGLLNRRAFAPRLQRALERLTADDAVGLMFIDLDEFKSINDSHGHVAGDNFLRELGALLSRSVVPEVPVARLGGDEFALILSGRDIPSLKQQAERILEKIACHEVPWVSGQGTVFRATASAGLTFLRSGATIEQLMSEADTVCYEAKNAGRNRVVVYTPPAEAENRSNADLRLRHFESATRLAGERLAAMIAIKSRRVIDAAKQEACICPLTGLPNRRHYVPALSREMERAHAQWRPLSLAVIDVDQFGEVNKVHGLPTGDRALQAFAEVARSNVRVTDWVARYAGDEFLVVMPDTPLDRAAEVVERVREAFASTRIKNGSGTDFAVTFSAGVAPLRVDDHTVDEFVELTWNALKRAKGENRNRVVKLDDAVGVRVGDIAHLREGGQ
jgi:diguanylate cyclase (GGDEF)-like protein